MLFVLFSEAFISAILFFCGAADISEVPESEYERFEHLSRHPVLLNSCTQGRLLDTGLLSEYQIASLVDYRSRNGSILSERELSMIDGFNAILASHLMEFVSLESEAGAEAVTHSEDVVAGTQLRINDGAVHWTAMGKTYADVSGRFGDVTGSVAYKMGNDVSWTASYGYGRHLKRVVAGAFNARFGQGLSQWSGVSMDAYASPSSLMRRQSGIGAYTGWSPAYAMMGIAAALDFVPVSICPFADIRGHNYGANIGWNHRHGHVGATISYDNALKCSMDFQHSVKGAVFFAELLYAWKPDENRNEAAALAGARVPVRRTDNAVRVRYAMDKADVTASTQWTDGRMRHNVLVGVIATMHIRDHGRSKRGDWQLKATSQYRYAGSSGLAITSRLNARLTQSMLRADIRQDAIWERNWLKLSLRGDGVLYMGTGSLLSGLLTADVAVKFSWVTSHLQCSLFNVGNWDSRIYLYQYDAPGSFNTQAMYGRGYSIAVYSCFKLARWARLYFRTGLTSYPWAHKNDARQQSSLDARLQLNCMIIPTRRN